MANRVLELFGHSTLSKQNWKVVSRQQQCPFLGRKCWKIRKSQADISIGTCAVGSGRSEQPVIICPSRLLERRQVFTDCIHLLSMHEPGNELHVVPEVTLPGGNVDYFLVSARKGKPIDFVGIELQTLDTTGTVWPERQRFLNSVGLTVERRALRSTSTFGMNWKMTAKTTLVQLHHKISTFEHLSKHLVLVVQDCLLAYMRKEFAFAEVRAARLGDAMHFHSYEVESEPEGLRISLEERQSTDAGGIATALGKQATSRVGLTQILGALEKRMGPHTVFKAA